MLSTSGAGRVNVHLDTNADLRLDRDTVIVLHNAEEIWLQKGRVYVDSGGRSRVRIKTPFASVADVGTQFEVALADQQLLVAVREGLVDVTVDGQSITAAARDGLGEVLIFEGEQVVSREPVATTDPRWHWVVDAAPRYVLDGARLDAFLGWATREAGLDLRYASPAVQQAAQNTVLQGELRQASLESAITNILETTRFTTLGAAQHELVIDFRR